MTNLQDPQAILREWLNSQTDSGGTSSLAPKVSDDVMQALGAILIANQTNGTQKTKLVDNLERVASISYQKELHTTPVFRLVGTSFNSENDPNFWQESNLNGGSVAYNGEAILTTGTTSNARARLNTVQISRFIPGSLNKIIAVVKFGTAAVADNKRCVGAYDDNNGFFFEFDGTTFSIIVRHSTTDTQVNSGSFNGDYGADYVMDTNYHFLTIEYGPPGVWFYIDQVLLHNIFLIGNDTELVNSFHLPMRVDNVNTGSTTSSVMDIINGSVFRIGEAVSMSISKYIAGATTTVLKVGPGHLHSVVNNDNSGSIIIYDNTAGSGDIIAEIDLAKVLGSIDFESNFDHGLTVVSTGAGVKITMVYE